MISVSTSSASSAVTWSESASADEAVSHAGSEDGSVLGERGGAGKEGVA